MSDLAWQEYKRAQQQRRRSRLPERAEEILALRGKGFDVVALTDTQFRVDGALDLYPIHRRYHVLATGRRGDYRDPLACAIDVLRRKAEGR